MKKRIVSSALSRKLSTAATNKRGIDAMRTVRGDPGLQARIDMVVENALSAQQSVPVVDVMYGTIRTHGVRRGSLKVHKVG